MIKKQVAYKYTNRLMILILLLSFAFILTSANTVSADSSMIYVNGSGGNDSWDGFSWDTAKFTIKNATGTVTEGGTVNIADGTYTGANNTNIAINKNMTIQGQSRNGTIINGTNTTGIFAIQSGKNVTISNLTLANGTAAAGGAIYNMGTLTVNGSTFTGNTNAIYNSNGGNLAIIGSTFTGNTVTGAGGAIWNGGTLTVNDSTFTSNTNAIYNGYNGNLAITGSIFTGNAATAGGAVYNLGSTLNVTDSTFMGNIATTGGAISNYNAATLNVLNSTFTNNTATSIGGAIWNGGTLTVNGSTFTGNTNAIYNGNGGNLVIIGSTFIGNNATSGGAVYNLGSILNVTGSTFTGNTVTGAGGAIWNGGTLTVNGSTFTSNKATNGGAISNAATLNVLNSTFTNNNATAGGAVYNLGSTLNVTGSTFTNNTATTGGAISNYNANTLNVLNSTFTNNTATSIGGTIWNGGTLTVNGSIFTSNTNAIYNGYNGNLTVIGSTFTNNTASFGGAISNSGTLTIDSSTFTGNAATNGGAISNAATLNVLNSTFTNNTATSTGGAIYSLEGTLTVNGSTFTGNTATGGGAILNSGDTLTVNGSTFIGNTATGVGGAMGNAGTLTINGSTFMDNAATTGGAIHNTGTAEIHFNRIVGNTATQGSAIYSLGGSVNAENNWWGSNSGPQAGSIAGSVNFTLWLVLNINASPTIISAGSNSIITVDLTHNSNGEDTSPQGHIPDGITVNFTTTLGSIDSSSATINGIAQSTFNAGLTLNVANVSAILDNETVYTPVQIIESPTANFTADVTSGDDSLTVSFTDLSTGTITGREWDFGDGTTSTDQNPTYTYTTPGTCTVKLTVIGPGGSSVLSKTNYIMVSDKTAPTVNITNPVGGAYVRGFVTVNASASDNINVTKVVFTINPGSTYTDTDGADGWNFNWDTTSLASGVYTVTAIAYDAAGNQNQTTIYVNIDNTAPIANASVKSGLYNINKTIYLTMSEPGSIYYTLNGATPTVNSTKYNGSIIIGSTTTLKLIAVDLAGNQSPVYTKTYTIDKIAPKVISTYPKNYATGVSRTSTIAIKFSENIKASINWSKIYVKNLLTGRIVSISKWISGNTLYIKMSSTRYAYRWYQVYIPAGAVKDSAGNNLAAKYSFIFKTGRY